jgi:hypothetical protein
MRRRSTVLAVIVLLRLVGCFDSAWAQETASPTAPIARPDLALAAQDLPPGYAEAPPLGLTFSGTRVQDRALRRTTPDSGPEWLWSATFESGISATAERVAEWEQGLARSLSGRFIVALSESVGADIELSDWAEVDSMGVGEYATLSRFHYERLDQTGGGEGALVVFSRGAFLNVLAVLTPAGEATVELVRYARLVDARVERVRAGPR